MADRPDPVMHLQGSLLSSQLMLPFLGHPEDTVPGETTLFCGQFLNLILVSLKVRAAGAEAGKPILNSSSFVQFLLLSLSLIWSKPGEKMFHL